MLLMNSAVFLTKAVVSAGLPAQVLAAGGQQSAVACCKHRCSMTGGRSNKRGRDSISTPACISCKDLQAWPATESDTLHSICTLLYTRCGSAGACAALCGCAVQLQRRPPGTSWSCGLRGSLKTSHAKMAGSSEYRLPVNTLRRVSICMQAQMTAHRRAARRSGICQVTFWQLSQQLVVQAAPHAGTCVHTATRHGCGICHDIAGACTDWSLKTHPIPELIDDNMHMWVQSRLPISARSSS